MAWAARPFAPAEKYVPRTASAVAKVNFFKFKLEQQAAFLNPFNVDSRGPRRREMPANNADERRARTLSRRTLIEFDFKSFIHLENDILAVLWSQAPGGASWLLRLLQRVRDAGKSLRSSFKDVERIPLVSMQCAVCSVQCAVCTCIQYCSPATTARAIGTRVLCG